jgi:hypothetical protein
METLQLSTYKGNGNIRLNTDLSPLYPEYQFSFNVIAYAPLIAPVTSATITVTIGCFDIT